MRIIEKSSKFHEGQRGALAQPRTLEIYHFLRVLDDIVEGGQPLKEMAVYKLPEGTEIVKTVPLMAALPSTPSVPLVSASAVRSLPPWLIDDYIAEPDDDWAVLCRSYTQETSSGV